MRNKDYKVTVQCTTTRTYIVNAADEEYAEDQAIDEVYGEQFHVDEFELNIMDVETC